VHIDDLAELFALALESAPRGAIYNAGGDEDRTVRELAEAASRAAGGGGSTSHQPLEEARRAMGPFADALASTQRMSSERAKRELGWRHSGPSALEDLERGSYAG
jgi:nucleoside-diphosphate-sugar epimerase